MSRWKDGHIHQRYCAGCGEWRTMFMGLRDPRRSLCQTCYVHNRNVRMKYGKQYRGPDLDPPHHKVWMWFLQPAGQQWLTTWGKSLSNFKIPDSYVKEYNANYEDRSSQHG